MTEQMTVWDSLNQSQKESLIRVMKSWRDSSRQVKAWSSPIGYERKRDWHFRQAADMSKWPIGSVDFSNLDQFFLEGGYYE